MKLITLLITLTFLSFRGSETLNSIDLRWAATVYSEGRGCDLESMIKDASVMYNRVTPNCDVYCVISKKSKSKTGKVYKQFSGFENSNYRKFITSYKNKDLDSKMLQAVKAINIVKYKGSALPKDVLYYRNVPLSTPHKWWDTLTIVDTSTCGHTYYMK